jgi:hypothetical protein
LDRLAKSDYGGLVGLVRMRSELEKQGKCDDHADGDIKFMNSHFRFSLNILSNNFFGTMWALFLH